MRAALVAWLLASGLASAAPRLVLRPMAGLGEARGDLPISCWGRIAAREPFEGTLEVTLAPPPGCVASRARVDLHLEPGDLLPLHVELPPVAAGAGGSRGEIEVRWRLEARGGGLVAEGSQRLALRDAVEPPRILASAEGPELAAMAVAGVARIGSHGAYRSAASYLHHDAVLMPGHVFDSLAEQQRRALLDAVALGLTLVLTPPVTRAPPEVVSAWAGAGRSMASPPEIREARWLHGSMRMTSYGWSELALRLRQRAPDRRAVLGPTPAPHLAREPPVAIGGRPPGIAGLLPALFVLLLASAMGRQGRWGAAVAGGVGAAGVLGAAWIAPASSPSRCDVVHAVRGGTLEHRVSFLEGASLTYPDPLEGVAVTMPARGRRLEVQMQEGAIQVGARADLVRGAVHTVAPARGWIDGDLSWDGVRSTGRLRARERLVSAVLVEPSGAVRDLGDLEGGLEVDVAAAAEAAPGGRVVEAARRLREAEPGPSPMVVAQVPGEPLTILRWDTGSPP